jgi:hypothetical protein
MCNLGIGYCRYELKGNLDAESLYPSMPIMSHPIVSSGLEAEIIKQNELLKEILAELKKTNDYIYRHENSRIAQEEKQYEQALNAMKAEKEFAENVLPHAGVGYLGDKEESDGN